MGLAASQARLLMITMRITDCQYDLMKLSGETMRINEESADLDEKYSQRLNEINYTYNFKGNGTEDNIKEFSYGDMMGASGYTAGNSPVMITNSANAVVFDTNMSQAARAAGLPEKGGTASYAGFGKFMQKLTNDSETNWATVLTGTTATTPGKDETATYTAAMAEFTSQYGSEPEIGTTKVLSPNWNGDNKTGNGTVRYRNNEFIEQDRIDDGSDSGQKYIYEQKTNSKGLTYDEWITKLKSFATQKGLDANALSTGNYPKGDKTTTTPADKTSDAYKKASYYYQIYTSAASNGWSEDQQVNSKKYLQAQLQNNNFKIGGKLASENDNVKQQYVDRDDANDWYELELKKVTRAQKEIDTKQTQVQTRLQAYTSEQQSVQSIIDKNIERSFTYMQA